jgi:hypothetical protein
MGYTEFILSESAQMRFFRLYFMLLLSSLLFPALAGLSAKMVQRRLSIQFTAFMCLYLSNPSETWTGGMEFNNGKQEGID